MAGPLGWIWLLCQWTAGDALGRLAHLDALEEQVDVPVVGAAEHAEPVHLVAGHAGLIDPRGVGSGLTGTK